MLGPWTMLSTIASPAFMSLADVVLLLFQFDNTSGIVGRLDVLSGIDDPGFIGITKNVAAWKAGVNSISAKWKSTGLSPVDQVTILNDFVQLIVLSVWISYNGYDNNNIAPIAPNVGWDWFDHATQAGWMTSKNPVTIMPPVVMRIQSPLALSEQADEPALLFVHPYLYSQDKKMLDRHLHHIILDLLGDPAITRSLYVAIAKGKFLVEGNEGENTFDPEPEPVTITSTMSPHGGPDPESDASDEPFDMGS